MEEEENNSAEDEVEPSNPDCEMAGGNQSSQQERDNPVVQHDNNSQQDPQQERANPVFQPNNNTQQETEGDIPRAQPNNPTQSEQTDAAAQDEDREGRMPGQLPTQNKSAQPDYANLKRVAKEKIHGLLGTEVTCKSRNKMMKWKVISDHEPEEVLQDEVRKFGLRDFNFKDFEQDEVLCHLFLKLTFVDWRQKVDLFNAAYKKLGIKGRLFSRHEFLVGLGLLIAAAEFSQNGKELFRKTDQKYLDGDYKENWMSMVSHPGFDQFMSYSRFKEFRRFLPEIWVNEAVKDVDPWNKFSAAIDEFNNIWRTSIRCSRWKVVDESMSAWRPRTTALGGLPNISFVVRKPEPLGTEFKTSACPITGVMTMMEIQRGKEGIKDKRYNRELGATTGCTLRLLEDTIIEGEHQPHGIRGDAWFGSVRTASEVGSRGHEGVF